MLCITAKSGARLPQRVIRVVAAQSRPSPHVRLPLFATDFCAPQRTSLGATNGLMHRSKEPAGLAPFLEKRPSGLAALARRFRLINRDLEVCGGLRAEIEG